MELLAVDSLDRCTTLPYDDVTDDMIRRYGDIHDDYVKSCYLDLIPVLNKRGRQDLVRAIDYRMEKYHEKISNNVSLSERIKRFDQNNLGGQLTHFKRNLQRKITP